MSVDKFEKMYKIYLEGKTLEEVATIFGTSKQAISKGFKVRSYETRGPASKRKRVSFVAKIDDDHLVEYKAIWNKLDSKIKGVIAESNVTSKLALLGFDVWMPYMNNHKADLGFCHQGKLIKIQVKSATYDLKTKRFRATLKTKDKRNKHVYYKTGMFDFFIIYCPGVSDMYIIPIEVGIENPSVSLMPHRKRIYRGNGIDWEQYKNAWELLG